MKEFIRKSASAFTFNKGSKELTRLCAPFLNAWGFENFYYVRITRKGELVYLTNHVDFIMDYWEAGFPLRTGFDQSPKEVQSFSAQWEGVMEQEILDFAGSKKCYNGFSFVDRYHDTVQFASFCRSEPLDNPSQYYMQNQSKLLYWLRQFEWKHRHLIKHAEENAIVLPEAYLAPQKEAFYAQRTVKIEYRKIRAKVSFRELDCLHLVCKGFTIPHIARVLGLSPRTVETHLERVKSAFGLYSRDELATLAYANPLIQAYSPRL